MPFRCAISKHFKFAGFDIVRNIRHTCQNDIQVISLQRDNTVGSGTRRNKIKFGARFFKDDRHIIRRRTGIDTETIFSGVLFRLFNHALNIVCREVGADGNEFSRSLSESAHGIQIRPTLFRNAERFCGMQRNVIHIKFIAVIRRIDDVFSCDRTAGTGDIRNDDNDS